MALVIVLKGSDFLCLSEFMKKHILIIGAGASGLMAAIQAAKCGANVTVLEHKEQAGKKLLSTGNGRCNLTNLEQKEEYYRCSCLDFPGEVLRQFSMKDTLEFFQSLGILPKSRNGYIYPNSDQAASVVEALLLEGKRLGVKMIYQCHVDNATKRGEAFLLHTNLGDFKGEALILAAGSKAAPVTGSDGSGYELAKMFGHRIIAPLPALVQLCCKGNHYKELAGVRTDARLTVYIDGKFLASDEGELQLTSYGISGIPTFQISRYASIGLHRKQKVTVKINFLPHMSQSEVRKMIEQRLRAMGDRTCRQWMNGILNAKLSKVLLKLAKISDEQKVKEIPAAKWRKLESQLTAYEAEVTATNPFENAQVCCGGVDVKQVQEKTLESRLVEGLYFCGELLDVDGICGGYNLQWAWSSGAVAGRWASK